MIAPEVIFGFARTRQFEPLRSMPQTSKQQLGRAEIKIAAPPEQCFYRIEPGGFDRFHKFGAERPVSGGCAKAAVVHIAARPARDLSQFHRRQGARPPAVKLAQAGESDVGHIHVKAHADRICCNHIIDFAGLIHFNLRIAGARRQCAEDDRRTAALTAHALRKFVDLADGKTDDRTPARQPSQI